MKKIVTTDSLIPTTWDSLKDGDVCYIDNSDIETANPKILGPYRVTEKGYFHITKSLIHCSYYAKEPYHLNRLRTFKPGLREINRLKVLK